MRILAGRQSVPLARDVADATGSTLVSREVKTFPDAEVYVRIDEDLEGEDVAVVQTTLGPDAIIELMLLLDAARERNAERIIATIPYFAYSRQDQRFQEGEAFSSDTICRMMGMYADGLLIVDPHKSSILDLFDGDIGEVSAVPELANHLKDHGVDVILAPDAGARQRAEMAATLMGVPYDHLEKKRIDAQTVEMKAKELDVDGKTVAILDDIISTGGTMARATAQLKRQGAKAVYCAATHGLLIGDCIDKLMAAGVDDVFVTDTIPKQQSRVSSAPAIVRGLTQMLGTTKEEVVRP